MLKNNAFTKDDDGQHRERLDKLKSGIVEFGPGLGFRPEDIAKILDYIEKREQIYDKARAESIEAEVVPIAIQHYLKPTLKQLYRCRKFVRGESVEADAELRDYFIERFMLAIKVPKRRAELVAMADNMIEAYDSLPAERPDVVFTPVPFEALRENLTSLKAAMLPASRERAEKKAARTAKREFREAGNRMLRKIYLRAVSFWGINELNLARLGMLPKSQVWTSKKKVEEVE